MCLLVFNAIKEKLKLTGVASVRTKFDNPIDKLLVPEGIIRPEVRA